MNLNLMTNYEGNEVPTSLVEGTPTLFDSKVQFLHIHIFRLLFMNPLNLGNPETLKLIQALLSHQNSLEFNKLGLSAVHSIA